MKLNPEHESTVIGTFLSVERQIKYYEKNIIPNYPDMEEWERKEYHEIYRSHVEQSEEMVVYLMQNESIFNQILVEYGLTVVLFIAKVKNSHKK